MKTIIAILEGQFQIFGALITLLEGYDSINYKVVSCPGNFVRKKYPKDYSTKNLLKAENEVMSTLSSLANQDFPNAISRLVIEKEAIYR